MSSTRLGSHATTISMWDGPIAGLKGKSTVSTNTYLEMMCRKGSLRPINLTTVQSTLPLA